MPNTHADPHSGYLPDIVGVMAGITLARRNEGYPSQLKRISAGTNGGQSISWIHARKKRPL